MLHQPRGGLVELLSGVHLHGRIEELVRQAERWVQLVSPYIEPWPELILALEDARDRGVHVAVIARGGAAPQWRPHARVPMETIASTVDTLPGLHAKLYVSDKHAIVGSFNVTEGSRGNAWEVGVWIERSTDEAVWLQAAEALAQLGDELVRRPRWPKREREDGFEVAFLMNPNYSRERALAGDEAAMDDHRFCIRCSDTVHSAPDDDFPWCDRCDDVCASKDEEVVGTVCHRCNVVTSTSLEKPYCFACYKRLVAQAADSRRFKRDLPTWHTEGTATSVEAWSADKEGPLGNDEQRTSLGRHNLSTAPDESWQQVSVFAGEAKNFVLAGVLKGLPAGGASNQHGVVLERLHTLERDCPQPLSGDVCGYLQTRSTQEATPSSAWERQVELARWELPFKGWPPAAKILALWPVFAAKLEAGEHTIEPSSKLLELRATLRIPTDYAMYWSAVVPQLSSALMTSAHRHDGSNVDLLVPVLARKWKVKPELVQAILSPKRARPLGPVNLFPERGQIGARVDRVVRISMRCERVEEGFGLQADLWTVSPGKVH